MVAGLAVLAIALAVGVGALLTSNGDDNGAVGAAAPVSRDAGNGGDEAGTFNLSDVTGLSLSDATSRLEDAGLHAVAEPQVSSRVELGRVIGTVPAAATKVVPGEGVFILVSSNAVPDVTNMTQDAAAAALEKNGFEVQASPEASSAVAAGRVIRTDPAAGTPVLPGGAVELIVASGQRPTGRPEVSGSPSARN
jgi:serine/threonine-protein kinase